MPIDPSIPLSVKTPAFNSPFEALGQMQQLRQQQQESQLRQQQLQDLQTQEQERQQKMRDQAQQMRDQAQLNQIISANPDRATVREAIRTQAPGQLASYDAGMAKLDESAATTQKAIEDGRLAHATANEKMQGYLAGGAAEVKSRDYDPLAFQQFAQHVVTQFPELQGEVQDRLQQAQNGTPIKAIIDGLMAQNVPVAKEARDAAQQQLTAPSVTPNAQGLTPPQQQEANDRAAMRSDENTRASSEAELARRAATGDMGAKKALDLLTQQKVNVASGEQKAKFQAIGVGQGPNGEAPSPVAQAMAEYRMPPISPRSTQTPEGQALMNQVMAINPGYDATQFTNRAKTRPAFTTGTQGQQITSINTAIGHLDQMSEAIKALNSGDVQAVNAAKNWFKTQTGSPDVSNFNTIKDFVSSELAAVAKKGAGSDAEIKAMRDQAAAKSSPAQLAGYVDTVIPLMGSKLSALNYQYHQAMGDKDPFQAVSPEAATILAKRGFDPSNPQQRGASGGASVTMTAPDGKKYNVPADKVAAAKAQGWQ